MRRAGLASFAFLQAVLGCSADHSDEPERWHPGPASVWVTSISDGAATGHRLLTLEGDFDIPGLFSECGGEVFVTNEATGTTSLAYVEKEFQPDLWGGESCVGVVGWSRLVALVVGENRLRVEVRSDEAFGSTTLTVFLREDLLVPRLLIDYPYYPTTTSEPVTPVRGLVWDAVRIDWANRTSGVGGSSAVEPLAGPRDPWTSDEWAVEVPLACGANVLEVTATSAAGYTTTSTVSDPVQRDCPYSISGTVSGQPGAVTVTLAGAASATTTTSGTGAYSFSGLGNGGYTVTPSLAGCTFSPTSRSVTVSGASVDRQDFAATAETFTISGAVHGVVASGVIVTLTGGGVITTTTSGTGAYSFSVPNGLYRVSAWLPGYTFAPSSIPLTVSGASVGGLNFTSALETYTVSGVVSGVVPSGITVALSGATSATTTTDSWGRFDVGGLAHGSYTVTPSLAGCTFSPASSSVTVSGASPSEWTHFTATCLDCTTLTGSVHIESVEDWNALLDSGCTAVTGDLTMNLQLSAPLLSVPALESIGGSLDVSAWGVTSFSLPELTSVGGGLHVNSGMTDVSLPRLTAVGGDLSLDGNGFTDLSLPALTTVGGGLEFTYNSAMTSFSLPALTTVGDGLNFSGALRVLHNGALTGFSLPALITLGGDLNVSSNVALPQCLAMAFKDHLVTVHEYTGAWTITGNDVTATCLRSSVLRPTRAKKLSQEALSSP